MLLGTTVDRRQVHSASGYYSRQEAGPTVLLGNTVDRSQGHSATGYYSRQEAGPQCCWVIQ